MSKIINYKNLSKIRKKYLSQKIVLCHGSFDLIHPEHLSHLKEAKRMGDILIVTITADKYVHKKSKRFFSQSLRSQLVASIGLVDYVAILNEPSAMTAIKLLKPNYYVKGAEFRKHLGDPRYNIEKEKVLVEKYGGKIYFTKEQKISSVKLAHLLMTGSEVIEESPFYTSTPSKFKDLSNKKYRIKDLEKFIHQAQKLKVAVIGETIIDKWIKIRLQGLAHKLSALSCTRISDISQTGGAGITALHLANFVKKVDLYTNSFPKIKNIPGNLRIHKLIKGKIEVTRYVNEDNGNVVFEDKIINLKTISKNWPQNLKKYDMVLVADFGRGLISEKRAKKISRASTNFLACMIQTNSSNYGFNVPTKYPLADYFSLNRIEAELCLQKKVQDRKKLVKLITKKLSSLYVSVTFGQEGAIISHKGKYWELESLSKYVKDPIGCGDAYFALSSLALATKQPPVLALFIGSIGAAIMSQRLCNEKAVSKKDFLTATEIII